MKHLKRALVALVLAAAVTAATSAARPIAAPRQSACSKTYTINMFRDAAITAYRGTRTPTELDRDHLRHFLDCARHPWDVPVDWRIWKRSIHMNYLRKHPPPPPLAYGEWAIPAPIVMCESHGQNLPPNGAGASGYYQIIPSTWTGYGGTGYAAYLASKPEQDAVASRIWDGGAGASQWVCAGLTGY